MVKLKGLIDTLARITERRGNRLDDVQVVVEVFNPGSIGGTPCVQVTSANLGIDWDANKFILTTDKALSTLSEEDKEAILESVKKSQSWHAYQTYKKQENEINKLKNSENRYEKLRLLNPQMFARLYKAHISSSVRFDDIIDCLDKKLTNFEHVINRIETTGK